MKTSWSIDRFS